MSPPWETFCFLGRNSPRPLWRPLAFLVRFGEARNISGCPVSQNFGNRWVANPCMWVTPSPPGSIEAWQGGEHCPGSKACSLEISPAENDTETRGLRSERGRAGGRNGRRWLGGGGGLRHRTSLNWRDKGGRMC